MTGTLSRPTPDGSRFPVGGTKAGFFGEQVELKGKYADTGYVSSKPTEVPVFVPLIAVMLVSIGAVLAAVATM